MKYLLIILMLFSSLSLAGDCDCAKPKLNIKVGHFYKTRDGKKVRIYALDGSGVSPIQGAILQCVDTNEPGWTQTNWFTNGHWWRYTEENHLDLIKEWK